MTDSILKTISSIQSILKASPQTQIIGEIVSYKISGVNAYITLKTDDFEIKCNVWKITTHPTLSKLQLSAGEKCKLDGKLTIFTGKLEMYFNVTNITKENSVGSYMVIQQQLREKIYNNNYHLNKRVLTTFPYNIGIITAIGGAAIQDVLQVFRQDGLIGNVIVKSALVQGSNCPNSVIAGIKYFEENPQHNIHLLLITRGGGSYEDLVEFSNWSLIEYINETNKRSSFITMSAIGHQIDNQLTDDICSYHFATPSISAKFIVETQREHKKSLETVKRFCANTKNKLSQMKANFIRINKDKIISTFNQKENYKKLSIVNDYIKRTLKKFNNCKQGLADKMSNLKPTMIKKRELSTIYDLIEDPENVTNKSSKMDIVFYDGKVTVSYKIVDYDFF